MALRHLDITGFVTITVATRTRKGTVTTLWLLCCWSILVATRTRKGTVTRAMPDPDGDYEVATRTRKGTVTDTPVLD